MDIELKPGKYIVAVSGGVDSMSLLHALVVTFDKKHYTFTVAHFDHGIRDDSHEDRELVQEFAKNYDLPFVYEQGRLGRDASEEKARAARYAFLRSVLRATDAQAILTAHHKDDARETAIFNILRGTGRQGLNQLTGQVDVFRPLIQYTKEELCAYANKHNIQWREDVSNSDVTYQRNYIRHRLIPRLTSKNTKELDQLIYEVHKQNQEIDELIAELLRPEKKTTCLDRAMFVSLPYVVAKEVLVYWLRKNNIRTFDRRLIELLTVAIKTGSSGSHHDIKQGYKLRLTLGSAQILGATEKKS